MLAESFFFFPFFGWGGGDLKISSVNLVCVIFICVLILKVETLSERTKEPTKVKATSYLILSKTASFASLPFANCYDHIRIPRQNKKHFERTFYLLFD